ncbi:MAG: zf-TFIIB domain-containing protein [Gemmatimonadetes bacterium]|nr:zf-TFIIB domain-containing protein [Gemmatimonadota bacterium]
MPSERKPSPNEDEFFAKRDADLMKAQRARLDAARDAEERHSHYMKCPKCGGLLRATVFHHVKIDRCPDCNGVWLDAGEMEQLEKVREGKVDGFVKSLFGLAR